MVKAMFALVVSLVAATDLDQMQMLQRTSRKSVARHSSTNDPSDWDQTIDTEACEGILQRCPMSIMTNIEQGFNEDKDLLEANIASLEESITETETQIEKINNKTEKIVNATLRAMKQVSRAEEAIGKVKERMKTTKKKFGERMDSLQESYNEVSDKVDRIANNSKCLSDFVDPMEDETEDETASVAAAWVAAPNETSQLLQKQSWFFFNFNWKKVVNTVKKVVDKATSDVLLANDQIWLFKIKDSQEDMQAEIEGMEEIADKLSLALEQETEVLVEALALRSNATENKTTAIQERNNIRAILSSLKANETQMKQNNKFKMENIRNQTKVLKAWLQGFKAKFGNSMFRQMSTVEFCP